MATLNEDFARYGYLQKDKTRDGFFENKFNISKSKNTVHNCNYALKSFDRFVFSKFKKNSTEVVIDDIKKMPQQRREQAITDIMQDFLFWKTKRAMASTAKLYYRTVVDYFAFQNLKILPHDLRRAVRLPKDPLDQRHPITLNEIKQLVDFSKPKRKALYTVLASSGMRIGEAVGLRKRDFDLSKERVSITIPARLTKLKIQRETFISKEAENYLLPLFKRLGQDQLVFGSSEDITRSVGNEELIFWKLRKQIGLEQKYENSRRCKITLHSFRAFCETQASNTNGVEYAHALIGHSGYLDQYYRITPEERLEKYIELEPLLTVGADFRKSLQIERLQREKAELEKRIPELVNEAIDRVKDDLKQEGWQIPPS